MWSCISWYSLHLKKKNANTFNCVYLPIYITYLFVNWFTCLLTCITCYFPYFALPSILVTCITFECVDYCLTWLTLSILHACYFLPLHALLLLALFNYITLFTYLNYLLYSCSSYKHYLLLIWITYFNSCVTLLTCYPFDLLVLLSFHYFLYFLPILLVAYVLACYMLLYLHLLTLLVTYFKHYFSVTTVICILFSFIASVHLFLLFTNPKQYCIYPKNLTRIYFTHIIIYSTFFFFFFYTI